MVSTSYIDAFVPAGKDASQCVHCGICLQRCPVMKMEREESKAEMARLIAGEDPARVLDECTLCFSCNSYCPHTLRPYNLIMERMTAKNRETGKGIPSAVDYMITGKNESGFFYDRYRAAPDEDKAILERWSEVPPPARETLFIGCYGRTVPRGLEHSTTLAGLAKFGPRDACCGEIPHRFGDYPSFSRTVDRTYRQLAALKTERLVCYCGSCANYLGNVWPNYHGVELPFEVTSLYEWLWEKYQAGEIAIQERVSKDIVISDSCYGSELGDGFFDALRGLHEAAGMSVVELENNRRDSLCCGFACGLRNNYDQSQVAIQAENKMRQILDTDVREVSCNCPGCWAGITQADKNKDLTVRFAINEILRAFGDDPNPGK